MTVGVLIAAQWWYGHNAVGFLLTAGFLGMMYYFVLEPAERPAGCPKREEPGGCG